MTTTEKPLPTVESIRNGYEDLYSPDRLIRLHGGNVYLKPDDSPGSHGKYLTDHVIPAIDRSRKTHWRIKKMTDNSYRPYRSPRSGVLEFTHNFAAHLGHPLEVAFLSAGPGPDSSFIATLPGVDTVHHVDYLQEANDIATSRAEAIGVEQKMRITTETNIDFLSQRAEVGRPLDLIIAHGGVLENLPDEEEAHTTLDSMSKALRSGGSLWIVDLTQPALAGDDEDPMVALDIEGVYPHAPNFVADHFLKSPMRPVVQEYEQRVHSHGDSGLHGHRLHRGVFVKGPSELPFEVGLQSPADPQRWQATQAGILTNL